MNVFYLDEDPGQAARYHCDKHIGKMIIECAQIMFTSFHELSGQETPYQPTHRKHPCVLWAGKSFGNWRYVYSLQVGLQGEWAYRWTRGEHGSYTAVQDYFRDRMWTFKWLHVDVTPPYLAMPEDMKIHGNPVESYRNYYRLGKKHLHGWTKREVPSWV